MSEPEPRDRDQAGRPRNARPRDGLGRPLARGSAGVERLPEGLRRSPKQTLVEAQRLLDDGKPFHAHEVFEDAWKAEDGPGRALWKGLAQLAVGLTHLARGNRTGAATLLRRGAETVAPFRNDRPHDLDVAGIADWATALAGHVEAGPVAVAAFPRLVAGGDAGSRSALGGTGSRPRSP